MSEGWSPTTGLTAVIRKVEAAAERTGRDPAEVTVVVVCKGRTNEEVLDLYRSGHRDLAENRAQRLVERATAVPDDVRWHFVGPLQTNKVRLVRPLCSMLHSLDRNALAEAWVKGPGSPPPVLIEVNVGEEPQKAGVAPDAAADLLRYALDLSIPVVGLMAIPPQSDSAEGSRWAFRRLARLRDELSPLAAVPELSMGMSDDYEVAVEEGATVIRVGRAIFSGPEAER